MQVTGAEEALGRLLDTQQELDRWLLENRGFIDAKIRRGIEQLDRGEGVPGDVAKDRLQRRKASWRGQNSLEAVKDFISFA